MKIVKLENGNIELRDNSGAVLKGLPPMAVLEISQEGAAVRANYGKNNIHDIYPSEVTETQILPAAAVPFSGGVPELLSLLNSSFFFEVTSGGTDNVIFQEQDATQDTTQAIYFIRHSFSGELAAGTYQIDSFQYLEILGGNGEIRNGIFIDTVLKSDVRATYNLTEPKPLLNRYIIVHGGGTVQIDSGFRRSFAATSATCTFSNLIIKKLA